MAQSNYGFRLVQDSSEASGVEQWRHATLALQPGDLLEIDMGATAATVGDSSTVAASRKGVVANAVSTGLSNVTIVNPSQVWEVDSANNSDRAHNEDLMVLSGTSTVNNSGTNSQAGIVVQVAPVGAAADKKILVRFIDAFGGSSIG